MSEYLEEIFAEHKAILDSIKERDVVKAKEAMARHLDGSKRRAQVVYKIKD